MKELLIVILIIIIFINISCSENNLENRTSDLTGAWNSESLTTGVDGKCLIIDDTLKKLWLFDESMGVTAKLRYNSYKDTIYYKVQDKIGGDTSVYLTTYRFLSKDILVFDDGVEIDTFTRTPIDSFICFLRF